MAPITKATMDMVREIQGLSELLPVDSKISQGSGAYENLAAFYMDEEMPSTDYYAANGYDGIGENTLFIEMEPDSAGAGSDVKDTAVNMIQDGGEEDDGSQAEIEKRKILWVMPFFVVFGIGLMVLLKWWMDKIAFPLDYNGSF